MIDPLVAPHQQGQSGRATSRRLARNTFSLSFAQAFRLGVNTVFSLLIARRLGAGSLGSYAVLTAYLQIFQGLATLGLPRLGVREMARQSDLAERRQWYHLAVAHQMVGAALATLGLIVTSRLMDHPEATTSALAVVSLSLVPYALSSAAETVLQATERMSLVAIGQIFGRAAFLAGGLWSLLSGYDVTMLAWILVIEQCLIALFSGTVLLRQGYWHRFRVDLDQLRSAFGRSLDFLVLDMSVLVFVKLDVLILSQLAGEEATGLYNAAHVFVTAANFVTASYSHSVYPVLSRLFDQSRERFMFVVRKSLFFGLIIMLTVTGFLGVAAEELIALLYGTARYVDSARLLRVLAPFVIVFMWNSLLSHALMACNLQRRSVVVSTVKLVLGFGLYMTLTALLGAMGTALAMVLAGFVGTALNYFFFRREVGSLDLLELVVAPMAVAIFVGGGLWLIRDLPWFVLAMVGCTGYLAGLMVFHIVLPDDIRQFYDMVRGPWSRHS